MSVVIVRSSCGCGISPGCPRCRGSGTVFRLSDSDDFAVGAPDEVDRLRADLFDLELLRQKTAAERDEYVEMYRSERALAWSAEKERDAAVNRAANFKAQAERADQADAEAAKWLQRASELQAERDALLAMNDRQALALMEADKRVAKTCLCRPQFEEKCLGCS